MGLWEIDVDSVAKDFADDLYFIVSRTYGTGMAPQQVITSPLPQQDGDLFEKIKFLGRSFKLQGNFNTQSGATAANYHSRKQALLKALNARASAAINTKPTPLTIRYVGSDVSATDLEIEAYYTGGGLEDGQNGSFGQENIDINFHAPNPFFFATSESSPALDVNDTDTFNYVGGREDGLWSDLGTPAFTDPGGGIGIYAIAVRPSNGDIYFGGEFLNADGDANGDYIVYYDISEGTWVAPAAMVLNGIVRGLAFDANDDLIAVGDFTNAGSVANADYIAKWNHTAWAAIGNPNSGGASITQVNCVAVGSDGVIYVGGVFANLEGDAGADDIAQFDGTNWVDMDSGVTGSGSVSDLAYSRTSGKLYAIGSFTNMGGVAAADNVAVWADGAWAAVGSGSYPGGGTSIVIAANGDLYAGGVTTHQVSHFNGVQWAAVGTISGGTILDIALDSRGELWAVSSGSTFDSLDTIGIARWNGSGWYYADIYLSNAGATVIAIDDSDNVWLGLDNESVSYAGSATIAYPGSARTHPRIEISRSGGTSARLVQIENYTTGARLTFDYTFLDGETLTIQFDPRATNGISVVSSHFGRVPNAILPGSDLGQFFLTGGQASGNNNNVITAFVYQVGSPTMTATLYYTAAYLSID